MCNNNGMPQQQQLHLPLWRSSVKTKHLEVGGGGGGAMWHASRVPSLSLRLGQVRLHPPQSGGGNRRHLALKQWHVCLRVGGCVGGWLVGLVV